MTNVTLLARNTLYYVERSELSKLQAALTPCLPIQKLRVRLNIIFLSSNLIYVNRGILTFHESQLESSFFFLRIPRLFRVLVVKSLLHLRIAKMNN